MKYHWIILYRCFKFLGLAPMSAATSGKVLLMTVYRENSLFEFSYYGSAYNLCLLIVASTIVCYFIYTESENAVVSVTKHYTVPAISYLCIFSSFSLVFVALIKLALQQRYLVKLGNELHVINCALTRLDRNYMERDGLVFKQSVIVLLNISIFTCIRIADFFCNNRPLESFCIYMLGIIASWIVLQYVCIVIVIKAMTRCINFKFKRLGNDCATEEICILETKPNYQKIVEAIYLKDLCLKLRKVTSKITEFYSLLMLGCIFKTFCYIIIELYYLIRPAVLGRSILLSPNDVASSLWLCLDTYSLILITYYVTETQKDVS